ncbi:MAG: Adenylosuccinate synthetase [Bacteroidetes bacterium ADurb.Bin037]|nr:MAG: Adenylosuccinate synthetase [Bacteroidetes bacterium ADurb.Bin037]HPW79046.1 adenylosuccinate synthase [Bacteroidales bacterium]HQB56698.1 adenylosuccinate synthase [Bacteroidales bacterium]
MNVDVVLGLQWGDEGKGKIVDYLARQYPVIARFQGGPNAGHSLHFEETSFVLHSVPSGIFRKGTVNIIGNGVVIDPVIFEKECRSLAALGIPVKDRLMISKRAHLILPTHLIIDAASEHAKGASRIGSTLKGISPAYMDKTGRNGIRVGDILTADFLERYKSLKLKHIEFLKQFDYAYDPEQGESKWLEAIDYMRQFKLIDAEYYVNDCLKKNKRVLAEGAQGALLDIDFGSYPYVTSSSTTCAGACIGLGFPPSKVGKVYGIFKAYCTRVGSGPFPTELFNQEGEILRERGKEFGATTGRPRRTGWLDLVTLKYAVTLNGVTDLIMMKADVMDVLETVKIATSYKIQGEKAERVPYDTNISITPVLREFKGWKRDLSGIRREEELPFEFMSYVRFIEDAVGIPIKIISLGPDREQTIIRD